MLDSIKKEIAANIVVDIIALIYIFRLWQYNKLLYEVQAQYSSKIEQAFNVIKVSGFFSYLLCGIICASLLIAISVFIFKRRSDIGLTPVCVTILGNLLVLIVLIIVFSNPIFTTIVTVITAGGAMLILTDGTL